METSVLITIVICTTIVLLSLIGKLSNSKKQHDEIMKDFKEEK